MTMGMFNGIDMWFFLAERELGWLQTTHSKESIIRGIEGWKLKNNGVVVSEVQRRVGNKLEKRSRAYAFPSDADEFIQDLADASLTHNIATVVAGWYEYKIYLTESDDGNTNIDADVIDALSKAIGREDI
jgi:hypothetical protein